MTSVRMFPALLSGLCALALSLSGIWAMLPAIGDAAMAQARPKGRAPAGPRYDRDVGGKIFYRIPPGYKAISQDGAVVMFRQAELAAREIEGFLLITPPTPLDNKVRRNLEKVGKAEFARQFAANISNIDKDKDSSLGAAVQIRSQEKDGFDAFSVAASALDEDAGKTRHSLYIVVYAGSDVYLLMSAGFGSQALLKAQQPGFTALQASLGFAATGAQPPARQAPPLPTDVREILPPDPPQQAARQNPEPPPARPRSSGKGQCYTVQRQMCSGGIGTSMGYFCNTYPETVCD